MLVCPDTSEIAHLSCEKMLELASLGAMASIAGFGRRSHAGLAQRMFNYAG
jgi:hypothetical protein